MDQLYSIRHSLAHVLAQAVQKHFPSVKLGFGPPTDTGFYYDFDLGSQAIKDEDLKKIQKTMVQILDAKQPFTSRDCSYEEAQVECQKMAEPYKETQVESLYQKGEKIFRFYQNGPFQDLCEGPHVDHTGLLPRKAFLLDRIAGAYWLGNEQNKMLTRIYALAFETDEELQNYLLRRKTAEQFDHKKLGKELELFHFDDLVGKGLPLWLPNGTAIRDEIETYAKKMEFKAGYKRVASPILAKEALYLKSQHLPAYEESMFPPMCCGEDEKFYIRPMNCPHHHLIYSAKKRSYRELPLRLAEYGTVFRYEQSGELTGLLRVRGMVQNDAHIYCRRSQISQEVSQVVTLYLEMFETFRLKNYTFRLSLRDPDAPAKFKGEDTMWDEAGQILQDFLDQAKIPYVIGKGEAAFYGPKIDIQFQNLMGREETVSTIQLDFLSPINFDLTYTDEEGREDRPVIIHRAPLSTHERFMSFLIEYYGGAFPTWLAPIQVMVIPVGESARDYALRVQSELFAKGVRAEWDGSDDSFGKKIRNHTVKKIPILLIVGQEESQNETVTLRRYQDNGPQKNYGLQEFYAILDDEIQNRRFVRELMDLGVQKKP
jgi:threonyl-tRNA synthetase